MDTSTTSSVTRTARERSPDRENVEIMIHAVELDSLNVAPEVAFGNARAVISKFAIEELKNTINELITTIIEEGNLSRHNLTYGQDCQLYYLLKPPGAQTGEFVQAPVSNTRERLWKVLDKSRPKLYLSYVVPKTAKMTKKLEGNKFKAMAETSESEPTSDPIISSFSQSTPSTPTQASKTKTALNHPRATESTITQYNRKATKVVPPRPIVIFGDKIIGEEVEVASETESDVHEEDNDDHRPSISATTHRQSPDMFTSSNNQETWANSSRGKTKATQSRPLSSASNTTASAARKTSASTSSADVRNTPVANIPNKSAPGIQKYPIEYAADNKSFKCLLCLSVTRTAQGRNVALQKRHMLTQREGHKAWVEKNHWIFNVIGGQNSLSNMQTVHTEDNYDVADDDDEEYEDVNQEDQQASTKMTSATDEA